MTDYQKIANVFKYLHDQGQEFSKESYINGSLDYADLQYNYFYNWFVAAEVFFVENVMNEIPVEKMRECLTVNGYY